MCCSEVGATAIKKGFGEGSGETTAANREAPERRQRGAREERAVGEGPPENRLCPDGNMLPEADAPPIIKGFSEGAAESAAGNREGIERSQRGTREERAVGEGPPENKFRPNCNVLPGSWCDRHK